MKKISILIAILLTQFMLVAYAFDNSLGDNGKIVFTSGGNSEDSPEIFMLLENQDGEPIETIHERSENEKYEEIAPYEAIVLTSSGFGFVTEENNGLRTMIGVYKLSDNQVLVIRNNAVGAAGPNHPRCENYFQIYNCSLENGFDKIFDAKLIDNYDKFENPGYSATERLCYINDNMVAMQEFFSQLSGYGITLKVEDIFTSEASDSPQKYEAYIADMDEACILSMMNRNADIPVNIYSYLGIEKENDSDETLSSSNGDTHLEGTLSDKELKAVKKLEKERAKERKKEAREKAKADGTAMPLGELVLRLVIAMLVVVFTVVTLIFAFSSAAIAAFIDMFVIFICMTLIGGDRMMRWLNLDFQTLLILFMLFFAGIIGCTVFDWDKFAGVIYTAQMIFLSLSISGIISSEVLESWITNVGLLSSLPMAIIVVFLFIFIYVVPAGIAELIIGIFKLL